MYGFLDVFLCLLLGILVSMIVGWASISASTAYVCNEYILGDQLEYWWTVIPILLLCSVLLNTGLVMYGNDFGYGQLIDIIAVQWYWKYRFTQGEMAVTSRWLDNRSIIVDNNLFLQKGSRYTLVFSSVDVVHSWSLPILGVKVDCVPGRLSCHHFIGRLSGLYVGYCNELCGYGHMNMPIAVVIACECSVRC